MLRRSISIGRIMGVEVGIHYSWLLIALLIAVTLGSHFQAIHPDWSTQTVWSAAILTSILFFAGLVLHELSHAAVARAHGLPVDSITLFALGGVAQITKEPQEARTEFWMAIAGPLASTAIGFLCLGIALGLGWPWLAQPATPVLAVLVWLGYINLSLAIFNMIPGYPLDGGRVLRSILWGFMKNMDRATRVAAQVGRGVAALFILWGLYQFFMGAGFGGLWIAFIGWFLFEAAGASYAQVRVTEALRGLRVRDLMVRDCPGVESRSNVAAFVEEQLARSEQRCFVVMEQGEIVGIVTPNEVRNLSRSSWPYTLVRDIMRPLEDLRPISPDTSVSDALEDMGRQHVAQLPVASNGHLEGFITRARVLAFLRTHAELRT